MSETHYALTESQLERLRRLAESVETFDRPSPRNWRRPIASSQSYIGALTSSVAATTALLGKPKVGTLNVYTFSSTGVIDTGIDLTVYNFAPQAATTDRWTVAAQCALTGKLYIHTQFCS